MTIPPTDTANQFPYTAFIKCFRYYAAKLPTKFQVQHVALYIALKRLLFILMERLLHTRYIYHYQQAEIGTSDYVGRI